MKASCHKMHDVRGGKHYLQVALFTAAAVMILMLPLAGVMISGEPLERYLEFPPVSLYIDHASFSMVAFASISVLITLSCVLTAALAVKCDGCGPSKMAPGVFPWWGWVSLAANGFFWITAWSRFSWFRAFQIHTFTPLWITYIVFINALTCKKTGSCFMLSRPSAFAGLFPLSALFWWVFEYLNRFVQNWHYSEVGELGAWEYFLYSSISFSTVLPAVLSTQELIMNSQVVNRCCRNAVRIRIPRPKAMAWAATAAGFLALLFIGIFPDYLHPFLWLSPLAVIASAQSFTGGRHIFSGVGKGDWRRPVSASLAALCCGFFWEMWNYYSLAKWYYTVPFMQGFNVFEMPIAGYAGYLPFGLECASAAGIAGIWCELKNPG
ncbi:MAG: hypothetical protein COX16_13385 [Deltaproteobacteria bacterium CG23_combo_of_CG06-09_8_20_14_all_51_20]|nr:MAG: hypothetical protein AUK25_00980 [Desulfobacteraceae bacterium CG2_30_51_40]PIP45399.1 MAG: hypothetical protein COX16_13385 [Deltaproteobacteria bacterium CG23_combo_of_CG06-09_8_20_14_all_51_20]PIW01772.1 MAG: hypothetical protein COW41_01675 [Deltaproteobacteria bacterium CG17_big_fil_post_rev_8_21_14_2_50_51_6]PIY23156.1 MAG: hypothetical protein COZ11_10280 [Deltaproteobacteria bacterium CG_4_10_14_3_um_filter_51_14]